MKFITDLQNALQGELPGIAAHDKMMSYKRPTPAQAREIWPDAKESAVLMLLFPFENQLHTSLILRPGYDGVHSRQVGFPGGKKEPSDDNLLHTALREAREEVNIQPQNVQILGQLTSLYIPPSNFIVAPYIGFSSRVPDFLPEEREVEKIIITPIQRILSADVIKTTSIYIKKYDTHIEAPYFDIDNKTVWGATAMMLSEFREIALPLWNS